MGIGAEILPQTVAGDVKAKMLFSHTGHLLHSHPLCPYLSFPITPLYLLTIYLAGPSTFAKA